MLGNQHNCQGIVSILKFPHALSQSNPQLLPPLATTNLFSVSIVLPFSGRRRRGIMQYAAYESRLLSVIRMHSILVIVAYISSTFLFYGSVTLIIEMYHHLFSLTNWPVEGHQDYFQFSNSSLLAYSNILIFINCPCILPPCSTYELFLIAFFCWFFMIFSRDYHAIFSWR